MSLLEEWNLKDAVAVAERDGRKMGREEGREEGMEMGKRKRTMEIAKRMKARGDSIDEIIELTGLTVDDVLRL